MGRGLPTAGGRGEVGSRRGAAWALCARDTAPSPAGAPPSLPRLGECRKSRAPRPDRLCLIRLAWSWWPGGL